MSGRCLRLLFAASALASAAVAVGAEALADPTRPSSAAASSDLGPEVVGVHVEAIVSRAGSRVAIVNGRLVRAGDRLGSIWIEEVTADGVRYLQNGRSSVARGPATPLSVRRASNLK